jgi:hypothetical protein
LDEENREIMAGYAFVDSLISQRVDLFARRADSGALRLAGPVMPILSKAVLYRPNDT